jgi:hypothetical protein
MLRSNDDATGHASELSIRDRGVFRLLLHDESSLGADSRVANRTIVIATAGLSASSAGLHVRSDGTGSSGGAAAASSIAPTAAAHAAARISASASGLHVRASDPDSAGWLSIGTGVGLFGR